ncbi:MAG: hypothetical protein LBD84_06015 [Campylobacteraceae bacterium]|jgi:hypothetical protein|nr:hypothetical protein [Campylobacteraceae bacterium]
MSKEIEALVVLENLKIQKKELFEEYIKKEGFESVGNEPFVYRGFSTTPIFNTKAYIFETFSKAFEKVGVFTCKLVCQIGENPPEVYLYEKDGEFFKEMI